MLRGRFAFLGGLDGQNFPHLVKKSPDTFGLVGGAEAAGYFVTVKAS